MGTELVGAILENYGKAGLILFILSIVSLTVFLRYAIKALGKFNWPWLKRRNSIHPSLRDHLFFTNAQYKLHYDIPTLELDVDPQVLRQVYRDTLYLNVEAFYYGCKSITELPDLDAMTGEEWGSVVRNKLASMLQQYENRANNFGVPPVILKKYIRWNTPYVDLLRDYIGQLANSTVYGSGSLRTNVFLLIMNLLLITMIGDMDKLASDTSDDLTDVEYKGIKLED
jgi:hypothetical protein